MTPRLPIILLLCVGLAGCGTVQRVNPLTAFSTWRPDAPLPFDARIQADRRDPAFSVSVATRGAPLDAWRESARFPATRHCLRRFGSSRIDWRSAGAPDDWIVAATPDGTATVSGRCVAR